MKKILALMLVGSMTLSLVACGKTAADTAESESVVVEEPSVASSVEEVTETIPEETTIVEEETEEEVEFTVGELVDGVYENSMLGIRFTPIDGMEFASDDYLAELSAFTAETLKDDKKTVEALKNGSAVISCYASTDQSVSPIYTFNVAIQSADSVKADGKIGEDAILDAAVKAITPALENNGFTNLEASMDKIEVLGEVHPCMYITADSPYNGKFVELEFVTIGNGYVASYTASSFGADKDSTMDVLYNVEYIK